MFSWKDSGAQLKVFQEGSGQSKQRNPRPHHPQVALRNSWDTDYLKVTGHCSPYREREQQQLKGKWAKGREDLKYSPQSGATLATPGVRAGSIWLPSAHTHKGLVPDPSPPPPTDSNNFSADSRESVLETDIKGRKAGSPQAGHTGRGALEATWKAEKSQGTLLFLFIIIITTIII